MIANLPSSTGRWRNGVHLETAQVTQRPKIFDVLRKCRDLAADEALVAGLLRVPPEQQHEIVRILIERGNEPGLIALPEIFHKLDHDSRTMILASTAVLFGSLRANIRSPQGQSRLNTLEIIRHSGCLQLGYLVAFALHDGSERVRSEAAQVLRQLTDKHWRGYEETTIPRRYWIRSTMRCLISLTSVKSWRYWSLPTT